MTGAHKTTSCHGIAVASALASADPEPSSSPALVMLHL